MNFRVPVTELEQRMTGLRHALELNAPDWELAVIMGKVNLYYLTGTMQNGVLLIPRDGEAVYWVRRSYTRACRESEFADIRPMRGFRDVAASLDHSPNVIHVEKEVLTLAHLERFTKHVPADRVEALDQHVAALRAVKSPYELGIMGKAGQIHRHVLEDLVPGMLQEGMSEVELGAEIMATMLRAGHEGVTRVGMFDTELFLGNICFGESSLEPNPFDSPNGGLGFSPAVPLFANRDRHLKRGDLVFVDIGCCLSGYHTDKTQLYTFGADLPPAALAAHRQCVAIHDEMAARLIPDAIPSQIFTQVTAGLDTEFKQHFMGYDGQQVRFLGHGIGLHIDELPVIAQGFEIPLKANMTIALEPKKGIPGIGMVGTENTFVVSENGGRCLTGNANSLIHV